LQTTVTAAADSIHASAATPRPPLAASCQAVDVEIHRLFSFCDSDDDSQL